MKCGSGSIRIIVITKAQSKVGEGAGTEKHEPKREGGKRTDKTGSIECLLVPLMYVAAIVA